MGIFNAGDVVTVTLPRGGGLLLALFRLDAVSGDALSAVHLRGAPMKEFFARDRISVVRETEESSFQATATITDVVLPDRIALRLESAASERPRREYVRIDDYICLDYEVLRGEERAVLEEFRRRAPRRPAIQLLPPGRFTQKDERNVVEELEKEILKVMIGMDLKIDAIVRYLAAGDRKPLMTFTPQWVNLSGSGLRFVASEAIQAGDFVEIRLHLQDGGGLPIVLLGVAIRTESPSAPPAKGMEVAVRYRYVEEEDRDRIIRYIFSRQREAIRSEAERKGGGRGVE